MNIKCILVGYHGSQFIVPASKYLTSKYLPPEWEIMYINHRGDVKEWTKHLATFLSFFNDEYIIFALDDYLIADKIDTEIFEKAYNEMGGDVVCIKLCKNTEDEFREYPVTTQYCIWNREYLISLLNTPFVETVWEWEIECSRHYFNKTCLLRTCIEYYTNSSLSGRWEGINFEGVKDDDIKFIKENLL